MKNLCFVIIWPLLLGALFVGPSPAVAQSYWDPGSLNASPGSGGAGTWNSIANNWWVSGTSDTTWNSNNIAFFAGTAGTVTLGAAETATGITFTTPGYTVSASNALTLAAATITLPDGGSETINCPIAGTTTVTLSPTTSGPSTLTLGGTNTYTGATTINSGATLTLGGAGNLNNGTYAGAITDNGAFIYNSSAAQTNSGTVTGVGPITVEGSGTLTLTHANTGYTGSTTINPGSTLVLDAISAVGSATAITNNGTLNLFTGGTAQYSFAVAGSGVINFPIAYATASENDRFEGSVGGLSTFTGTVNVYTYTSTGATNGTGTIGSGQLLITAGDNLNAPGVWNIGPGTTVGLPNTTTCSAAVILNGPGDSQPYGALRLEAGANQTGNVLLNGNGITIGDDTVAPGPSQISGNISDGGNNYGWAKAVGNPSIITTIILSGNNTYTGPTIFSSLGTLQVGSAEIPGVSGPLGKSPAFNPGNIVFSGATLQYSAANSNDYSGRFSTNAGQDYNIDVNGQSVTFASPLTSSGGELTLADTAGGGTLTLKATNTYNGTTTINGGTLNVSGSIKGSTVINLNGGANLEISSSTALSPGTTLTLNGGQVNLNFSGTQTILALYFGTAQQPAGTYSASSNNSSGAFTGTGTLNVAPQIFWDGNGTDAATQSSASGGGNGIWNSSSNDWWVSGSSDTTWTSNSIANFAGTAGTVTLTTNETANGLVFATSGYTITNTNGSPVLTLAGTPTIALPSGGPATVYCPIAGTGGLTESGSGALMLGGSNTFTGAVTVGGGCFLVLGGANAYAGATTINSGSMLIITNAGDLGDGNYPGAIANTGSFIYGSSANQTLSGIISGSGSLTQYGPGTLTLGGLNTMNSPITISSGTLTVTGDLNNNVTFNTGGYSGALNDNGAFIYNSLYQETISSAISGTGSLTQSGAGTLTLSGNNNYTGVTMIGSNSDLILSATGLLGGGDYETNIINNGTFTYGSSASPQTIGGVISGSGVLTLSGSGTLNLTGSNTYSGTTTISTGTLALSGSGSISNSTSISIAANAIFDVSALSSSSYALSSKNTLNAIGTAAAAATVNGPSGIVNLGSQPIALTFAPQTFNGDTFHQALNISQGALMLNGNVISVHITGGTALGAGAYTLINVAGGSISGSATLGAVSGAGLAAGMTGLISISGGSLNLVVAAVPTISHIAFSPGQLVLSGINGPANGSYYVLTSTNLALPLPKWTTNAVGAFSATGTFSVTNVITASPSFFVIEVAP